MPLAQTANEIPYSITIAGASHLWKHALTYARSDPLKVHIVIDLLLFNIVLHCYRMFFIDPRTACVNCQDQRVFC